VQPGGERETFDRQAEVVYAATILWISRSFTVAIVTYNRSEAAEAALERFVEHHKKGRQLQRFLTRSQSPFRRAGRP